jgi:hypothetical protein
MISAEANIDELLRSLIRASFGEVIDRLTEEKRAAEAMAKQSVEPLRSRMFDYTQLCRCLKFWLTTKNKPRNCEAFEKFRPLTESLISQGSLPLSMLEAFERPPEAARYPPAGEDRGSPV